MRRRPRLLGVVVLVAALGLLGYVGWRWRASLLPSSYDVMSMGYHDMGAGAPMPMAAVRPTPVPRLDTDPHRPADQVVTLRAAQGRVRLADGRTIEGYTVNGTSPGPTLHTRVGQLLEVRLHNDDVTDGITLHWHGVDVPDAEDGVAGVTQDVVLPGQTHVYRWVAPHAGTYWYHSHTTASEQVGGGLFGGIVIDPPMPDAAAPSTEDLALVHTYEGVSTIDGRAGVQHLDAAPGTRVRLRVVNTDNGPLLAWSDRPLTLAATDGYDVHGATPFSGRAVDLPAGGRADLTLTTPADGSAQRVQLGAASAVVVGPPGATARPVDQPARQLDRDGYGTAEAAPFRLDRPDRTFTYDIGRQLGFVDGKPGLWWSIDGHLYPDVPMFVVRRGEVVRFHLANHSGDVHPMHLHGHHAIVVRHDGRPVRGALWWVDSLDVRDGESYDIEFLADNPGIWMDHCHNLNHAGQGLMAHLVYEGVTTPYRVGGRNRTE